MDENVYGIVHKRVYNENNVAKCTAPTGHTANKLTDEDESHCLQYTRRAFTVTREPGCLRSMDSPQESTARGDICIDKGLIYNNKKAINTL